MIIKILPNPNSHLNRNFYKMPVHKLKDWMEYTNENNS
jgi:hypothetical protein